MDCSFDYSLISHPLYITALSSHVISSIFTLISATLVLLICKNTHALNGSIRVQLYTLFFFTFLHSIVLGSFQLFHLIRDQIFSTRNDCSILLPSSFCCLFRIPFAFSIAGLVLCWFSCAIDRCIASIFPKMRDSRLEFTAKGLVSMTFLATFLLTFWTFQNEDFSEMQVNCGASTKSSAQHFTYFFYFLMILDVLAVGIFLSLYFYNKLMLQKKSFELRFRFQVEENLQVIVLLSPIVIAHFLVFLFYTLSTVIVQANKTNFVDPMLYVVIDMHCYVVPYFTICLPFLFALMVWRGKRIRRGRIATMVGEKRDGRAGAEAHFSAMEIMWKSRVSIGGNGWENEEKKRKKPFEKIRVISARP